jgi:predicted Fe-Mo cluster-binding NifX family protein
MKIAVASNDLKRVTGHLGRCKSFIIYNAESGKITGKEIRQNTFTHHSQGDHGHNGHQEHGEGHNHSHAALVEALSDCEAVIFQSGGWRVIEDLKAGNVVPFLTDERIADTAAEKYLKGELQERQENACDHNNN